MNKNRKSVEVPWWLVERSQNFATKLIAHYAAGGSPASRAVSGDRGTEKNPILLGQGKVGECATAIFFKLDPLVAVKWTLTPDKGSDITVGKLNLDVKTTIPPYNLIWSRNVNHLFDQKEFDHLVSVSIDPKNWNQCWIEGYVPKSVFFAKKVISDGRNSGLEAGTWFMSKDDLLDINDLLPKVIPTPKRPVTIVRACRQCNENLNGSEDQKREVWVAGTRIWLHRACEDSYFEKLKIEDGVAGE